MTYFNNLGQGRVGWRSGGGGITPSTLWNSIYAVYNADSTGSSSLKTSLYAVYNGESNANDSYGSNNGTAQGGLSYVSGKLGNAFQFNGTNAYVSLPNNAFNPTGDFTISAWINFANNTDHNTIFSSYSAGGTWGYGVLLYREGPTNWYSFEMRNGSNILLYRCTNIAIPLNTWTHVTVVRTVGQDPKFYVNGTFKTGSSYTYGDSSVNPAYQANQICNIGGHNNGSLLGNYKQDSTTFWNRALSASEITELYNSGYSLQYSSGSFIKPSSVDALNTYNGTAQGGLTYDVGKIGTAFKFNNTNSYITLPNNSLNFTGDFTTSFWFKQTNPGNTGIDVYFCNFNSSVNRGWQIYHAGNGYMAFYWFNNSGTYWVQFNTDLTTGTNWRNYVITKSTSGEPICYQDGVQVSVVNRSQAGPINTTITYDTTHYPSIGAQRTGAGGSTMNFYSECNMDGINFWNKLLTSTEITELYNSGNGKQYPN